MPVSEMSSGGSAALLDERAYYPSSPPNPPLFVTLALLFLVYSPTLAWLIGTFITPLVQLILLDSTRLPTILQPFHRPLFFLPVNNALDFSQYYLLVCLEPLFLAVWHVASTFSSTSLLCYLRIVLCSVQIAAPCLWKVPRTL
jgi:hypothetical protein